MDLSFEVANSNEILLRMEFPAMARESIRHKLATSSKKSSQKMADFCGLKQTHS